MDFSMRTNKNALNNYLDASKNIPVPVPKTEMQAHVPLLTYFCISPVSYFTSTAQEMKKPKNSECLLMIIMLIV